MFLGSIQDAENPSGPWTHIPEGLPLSAYFYVASSSSAYSLVLLSVFSLPGVFCVIAQSKAFAKALPFLQNNLLEEVGVFLSRDFQNRGAGAFGDILLPIC